VQSFALKSTHSCIKTWWRVTEKTERKKKTTPSIWKGIVFIGVT